MGTKPLPYRTNCFCSYPRGLTYPPQYKEQPRSMPSYTYAVKEHHLDKQKKYTDKVLMSSKTKQRERHHPRKNKREQRSRSRRAPSTRNLQTRVALFAPLERGNVLARIETFRLGGGWKDDGTDEKNLEKKFLHFIVLRKKKK